MRSGRLLGTALVLVLASPAAGWALFATSGIHKALFHFDEGAGSYAADAVTSGDACLGAVYAQPCPALGSTSPAWSAGRFGSGLLLDGVDDTVTFAHHAGLDWTAASNHLVMEAWIRPVGAGTIFSKGGAGGFNYRLRLGEDGHFTFSYTDTRGKVRTLDAPFGTGSGGPLSLGQWHWISVSFGEDANELEIRVDGGRTEKLRKALKPLTNVPDPRANTAPLSLGSFGGTADFFAGAIDEVRVTITPDVSVYGGGYPQIGSDRGVVISRVEFSPLAGSDFIELFRPDLGDGAGPVPLSMVRIYDGNNGEYEVPGGGGRCAAGNASCYEISPGETVRIWLDGAGTGALDTASTTYSEWRTSNCSSGVCSLGDGGANDLGSVDFVKIRSSGLPTDPDSFRTLANADVVAWGGDWSANPYFLPLIVPEGLWPNGAWVATGPLSTGIQLTLLGDNHAGPASWTVLE